MTISTIKMCFIDEHYKKKNNALKQMVIHYHRLNILLVLRK